MPVINNQVELAYQFAGELSKLLITVSAGILALGVSIIKSSSSGKEHSLKFAWPLYFSSIITGFLSLMALTGSLENIKEPPEGIVPNAKVFAGMQILLFLAATALFMRYGLRSLSAAAKAEAISSDSDDALGGLHSLPAPQTKETMAHSEEKRGVYSGYAQGVTPLERIGIPVATLGVGVWAIYLSDRTQITIISWLGATLILASLVAYVWLTTRSTIKVPPPRIPMELKVLIDWMVNDITMQLRETKDRLEKLEKRTPL
jgi:hypothetical protein